MQKYGILKDGKLHIVGEQTAGAKPIVFAPLPEFDQTTQAVYPDEPIENDHIITIDYAVRTLEADEETETEGPDVEFVERKPWVDPGAKEKDEKRIELLENELNEYRNVVNIILGVEA